MNEHADLLEKARDLMHHLAFMAGTSGKWAFKPSPEGVKKLKAMGEAIRNAEAVATTLKGGRVSDETD